MAPNEKQAEQKNPNVQVPEWVKQEYFEDILKEIVEWYSKVLKFKPEAGTLPGENFASVMLRINFEVECDGMSILFLWLITNIIILIK